MKFYEHDKEKVKALTQQLIKHKEACDKFNLAADKLKEGQEIRMKSPAEILKDMQRDRRVPGQCYSVKLKRYIKFTILYDILPITWT